MFHMNNERLAILSAEIKTNSLTITAIILLLPLLNVMKLLKGAERRDHSWRGWILPDFRSPPTHASVLPSRTRWQGSFSLISAVQDQTNLDPQAIILQRHVFALARDNLPLSYTFKCSIWLSPLCVDKHWIKLTLHVKVPSPTAIS